MCPRTFHGQPSLFGFEFSFKGASSLPLTLFPQIKTGLDFAHGERDERDERNATNVLSVGERECVKLRGI